MNKQKLVSLCAIVLLCAVAFAGCGGGSTQTSGVKVRGERFGAVATGGYYSLGGVNVIADWQFDNGTPHGSTTRFGPAYCGGPCPVNDGRVPARWRIVAGPFGECPGGQLTNPFM